MTPRDIRNLSDLPQSPRRHQILLQIGRARHRRKLVVWWQRGQSLRPCLAVTAMIHGDEYEGFAAALSLWKASKKMKLRGSLLVLPVCNPWAAEIASRHSPKSLDGKNLARIFPGRSGGTPTQQLAGFIWGLVSDADALVDLHSGGAGYDYAPLAGFYRKADVSLAACFPLPYLWKIPVRPGVLSREFVKLGKPAIGCEYAGEARLNRQGAAAYLRGVLRVMQRLGVSRAPARDDAKNNHGPRRQTRVDRTTQQSAPNDGWFFAAVALGQKIRRGEPLGEWTTPDLQARPLLSRHDGIVLAVRTLPRVNKGEPLVLFGRRQTLENKR
ncbi:MAG: succinylglutamate desuccinylase/aspartoacylase family protein [Verrucomicrobia bacterium]|nr:succinylglutamate desuccinylase/aspartoacylase family protein [Verrucomicrobiota bacterium]